jgi:predicted DNA-binding transcriptional regulator AlpA
MGWTLVKLPDGSSKGVGLVRPKDAAKLLGVHRNTLDKMEKRGELPPRKRITARLVGWDYEVLQRFIDTRETVSLSKPR